MCPGVYISPPTEDRTLFKVVWLADRTLDELRILANAEPSAFGLVRSRSGSATGYGIRLTTAEYLRLRKTWIPSWIPEVNTPYDLAANLYFFLDKAPLSSGKAEIQSFLKELQWPALAIRQTKPRQWLIGASQQPPRITILVEHGTMLIRERSPKRKGKGKSQAPNSWLLAGARAKPAPQQAQLFVQPSVSMQVDTPSSSAMSEVEDRLQRRRDEFCQQQQAAQHMIKNDLAALQADVRNKFAQQEAKNAELGELRLNCHEQSTSNPYRIHPAITS